MIRTRQIDIKNQYSLERKNFHHQQFEAGGSLPKAKYTNLHNNYNIKPLQGAIQTQISFKGFDFNLAKNALKPTIKPIPRKLTEKVFASLKRISFQQYSDYTDIRNKYVELIKTNSEARKKLGIPENIAKEITNDNLYYIPKKKIANKFFEQLVSPLTALYKSVKKVFTPKEKQAEINKTQKIIKDFSSLEGLIKSHEIWENGYRKMSGNPKWTKESDFLIPNEILDGKISRRRKKFVDPEKGKYSMTSLMLGNRFISGIVYSYFLGTDAYNTTMRYSNDKHEANMQRNSRIAQEFSRIGLSMYIQNLLYGTFEAAVNRSLSTALFVSGSTAAFSEILGRKLVGKPIMPSDKETLDRLEKEMSEKKGILPAIGRLLTNVKKKPTQKQETLKSTATVKYIKSQPNHKLFNAFSENNEEKNNIPSFKGFYEVEKLIDKKEIKTVLAALKKADKQEYEKIKETIKKALNKSEYFKQFKEKFLQENPKNSEMLNDIESLLEIETLEKLPLGMQKTAWGQLTKSILVPINFIKNTATSTVNGIRKIFRRITGKPNNLTLKELNKLKSSTDNKDIKKLEQFNNYYTKRLKLPAWNKSNLNEQEKMLRLFEEFKSLANKDPEEIEGAKNILLWLNNQIKQEKIIVQKDGTLSEKDVQKVKDIMKKAVMLADGSKHVEYDGNTITQTNINLSRAITTLFLVTDAYNLTMQYSGDNKKDANKSAKNRAAQEISRISVSAYIMAFVHNLLGKLCNSSLGGAFTLTALTSSINDSLSRKVVGVPLTAKNQTELREIDQKNNKSKNPIKKALAYSIGKKGILPSVTKEDKTDYFKNEFFITPKIN
ncbi:MAG: hypothetical protein KHX03_00960 [Clostridium sp.]|nr:hypothetical protein [Clostridium sp.]